MRKIVNIFVIVASITITCFSLTGCSSQDKMQGGIMYRDGNFPVLTATGYSVVSIQPGKTYEQKVISAMRASKLDAYRELSEQVHGIQIDSYTTLNDYVQTDEELDASVSGLVKGAKVIRTYPVSKNVYATEVSLDTKVLMKLYSMRGAL